MKLNQQYNLDLEKNHIEVLNGIGNTAWIYPDTITEFMS
jgi:hypothetical protein